MTPAMIEALRRDLVHTSRALHARGWVANHDGNLSARLDDPGEPGPRVLCSPTAVSKADVTPESLIVVVEDQGQRRVVEGTRRAFSELSLHLAAFEARPDIRVVLHAHPPTATGFAVAGMPIPHPFMAEPVVSLGPTLPVVPWHRPGDAEGDRAVARALAQADAVLLDRHGVLTVGGSFEQALLRMELVEHLARVALVAQQLGGVRPLPAEDVAALAAKGRPPSEPARAPAPTPDDPPAWGSPAAAPGGGHDRPDLRSVVTDALRRFQ
ncbi:class II aldolase/adducin family protein [Myxococcota bacterium]|nr:class II aldolase/adducin family protein [Myxococcota bacterium]